ncbi:MAG TPA: response regulator transcription factor [Anaerolineales bacterium]|jgi:NarL family two-component system response regulator LiaR|nr:response regulator transcription factor [Anaerolineales bacterium]
MEENIRILIVDDHAIVREGLRALIESEAEMELAGEAQDGVEAVAKARSLKPDVILLDLVMPHMDGIEATRQIKKENDKIQILVLTSFSEDAKVFSAIKSGAMGYLLKDSSPQDLLRAIRDVYHGEPSLHPSIARKLMSELNRPSESAVDEESLTDREEDVLRLLAQGLSNQDIADKLYISERTVRTHVSNILMKLHLANRTQAALHALRGGLVSLDSEG